MNGMPPTASPVFRVRILVVMPRLRRSAISRLRLPSLGVDGHGYVLDDASGVMAPADWAVRAIGLYHERRADRIVAETNNGGEMVEATLRMVDPRVPFRSVWASRS